MGKEDKNSLLEEKINGLLMSWEEYKTREWPAPYIVEIKKDQQTLTFFGAEHSNDPEHPQFVDINTRWQEFRRIGKRENQIVFVEGGDPPVESDNEAEQIKEYGEPGQVVLLAERAGVKLESPEPSDADILADLLEVCEQDAIIAYFSTRALSQWHTSGKPVAVERYLEHHLTEMNRPMSFAEIDAALKKVLGNSFDYEDTESIDSANDPLQFTGPSNEVARQCSLLRDIYIVRRFIEEWEKGNSVFAVYGLSHVVVQERALRELLK